jgi:hypothetical protein
MISEPGVKPSDAVALTVRVAVAVLPAPILTCWTLPIVELPVVNVIGPVSVPAVDPVTVADRVTLLPNGNDVGFALTAVVVAAVPCATTVIVTLELVDPMYVVFPELKIAETECVPEEPKLVVGSAAVKGAVVERATGVCATPSTVNVTVPVGGVVRVFAATVAVKVTFSLIAREVPGAAVSVVLVPVA